MTNAYSGSVWNLDSEPVYRSEIPATTDSNGNGGNGRNTKKCGGGWSGFTCHISNGAKRVQNFTTDHPVVRAVIVMAVEIGAGAMCYTGGIAGAIETGGASAVAAAVGCAAAVGALGAAVNNMLDGNADHSAGGLLKDELTGASIAVTAESGLALAAPLFMNGLNAALNKLGGSGGSGGKAEVAAPPKCRKARRRTGGRQLVEARSIIRMAMVATHSNKALLHPSIVTELSTI
ncbi:hypothetical protein [Kitasatospora griseola]|uniref:hypothetical protein n=1 Tax=Kitasatospora griseola TaxID=2064 RepID=UPI0038029C8B